MASCLDRVLARPGPFADPDWVPGAETKALLESARVLSVTAWHGRSYS